MKSNTGSLNKNSFYGNKKLGYIVIFFIFVNIFSLIFPSFYNPFYLINLVTFQMLFGDLGTFFVYGILLFGSLWFFFKIKITELKINYYWLLGLLMSISMVIISSTSINEMGISTTDTMILYTDYFNTYFWNDWIARFNPQNFSDVSFYLTSFTQMGVITITLHYVLFGFLGFYTSLLTNCVVLVTALYFLFFDVDLIIKLTKSVSSSSSKKNNKQPKIDNVYSGNLNDEKTKEFKVSPKAKPNILDTIDPNNPKDAKLLNIFENVEKNKNSELTNISKTKLKESERLNQIKEKMSQKNSSVENRAFTEIHDQSNSIFQRKFRHTIDKGFISPVHGDIRDNQTTNSTSSESKVDPEPTQNSQNNFKEKANEKINQTFNTNENNQTNTSYEEPKIEFVNNTNQTQTANEELKQKSNQAKDDVITIEEEIKANPRSQDFYKPKEEPIIHSTPKPIPEPIEEIKKSSDVEKDALWCKTYKQPSINLLSDVTQNKTEQQTLEQLQEVETKIAKLNKLFVDFSVPAKVQGTKIGPSITIFEVEIAEGTMVNKISSLENNIKLSLEAKVIIIETPIPGKSVVGIHVPNKIRENVWFKEILMHSENVKGEIIITLGKNTLGEAINFDLTKTPHMLIAGSTGSGKSVAISTLISSILMRYKPTEVNLVLVDPKMVEFNAFKNLPHLLAPIITKSSEATKALKSIVDEMEKRYILMADNSVKNIIELNMKFKRENKPFLPYIVVVVDELADLMQTSQKDVEESILRITQKARASGIHMVVATQRPSVDVITGVIKSNIPTRVAFTVASQIDSRTILDQNGADKLIGRGDLLFSFVGEIPFRAQGCFIKDEDINKITDHIREQCSPIYTLDIEDEIDFDADFASSLMSESDPDYQRAKALAIKQNKISASLINAYLNIPYKKASKIIAAMEENGFIGPSLGGNKPRELIK